jgi:hypothetical protein
MGSLCWGAWAAGPTTEQLNMTNNTSQEALLPSTNLAAGMALQKEALRTHPMYALIESSDALRLFMQHHVICVLDFMWLLKSLQRDLTTVTAPWIPALDGQSARLINEIVLGEESDQFGHREGEFFGSHFEWYLEAMDEVGCERGAIDGLVAALRDNTAPGRALAESSLPFAAQCFARDTLASLNEPLAVRVAVFFHGREDVIPRMFLSMVAGLRQAGIPCGILLGYLERHIEVDGASHGPMAEQLLERLCGDDVDLRHEAESKALGALESRQRLWGALAEQLTRKREFPAIH